MSNKVVQEYSSKQTKRTIDIWAKYLFASAAADFLAACTGSAMQGVLHGRLPYVSLSTKNSKKKTQRQMPKSIENTGFFYGCGRGI